MILLNDEYVCLSCHAEYDNKPDFRSGLVCCDSTSIMRSDNAITTYPDKYAWKD